MKIQRINLAELIERFEQMTPEEREELTPGELNALERFYESQLMTEEDRRRYDRLIEKMTPPS